MNNAEKTELRYYVKKFQGEGKPKKEAIEWLVSVGFVRSTVNKYWNTFEVVLK